MAAAAAAAAARAEIEEILSSDPEAEEIREQLSGWSSPELLLRAIYEQAAALGIEELKGFAWIAARSLVAPLPEGWVQYKDEEERLYYYHEPTGNSRWEHPRDDEYRAAYYSRRHHDDRHHHDHQRVEGDLLGALEAALDDEERRREVLGVLEARGLFSSHDARLRRSSERADRGEREAVEWRERCRQGERRAKAAEAAAAQKLECALAAGESLQRECDAVVARLEAATRDRDRLRAALGETSETARRDQADLEEAVARSRRVAEERTILLERDLEAARLAEQEARRALERERVSSEAFVSEAAALREEAESRAAQLEAELDDAQKSRAAAASERAETKARMVAEAGRAAMKADAELSRLGIEVDEARHRAAELEEALGATRVAAKASRDDLFEARTALTRAEAETKRLASELERTRLNESERETEAKKLEKELEEVRRSCEASRGELAAAARATTTRAKAEQTRLGDDLAEARRRADRAETRVANLEDQLEHARRSQASATKRAKDDARVEIDAAVSRAEMLQAAKNEVERRAAGLEEVVAAEREERSRLDATGRLELEAAQRRAKSLEEVVAAEREERSRLNADLDAAERRRSEANEARRRLEASVATLEATLDQTTSERDAALALDEELSTLRERSKAREEYAEVLEAELAAANARLDGKRAEIDRLVARQGGAEEELLAAARARVVGEYEALYRAERKRRRRIHDKLMALQGNIRVACRCRPPLPSETSSEIAVEYPDDNDDAAMVAVRNENGTFLRFEFDAVLKPGSSQGEVYEVVAPFIQSALDGYAVTIFTYGQTGSGKSHTMLGPDDDRGVYFRSVADVFANNSCAEIRLSILEIYNETLRDLLGDKAKKLEIRQNSSKKIVVPGLEERAVESVEDVEELVARGTAHRAVAGHEMNAHSSRSHLIITLHLDSRVSPNLNTKLHLIDLAGSERLSKTKAAGSRLREAQNINKSLSALGDVIQSLGTGPNKHVPYRNSKLTFFLQDALGAANAKVLVLVNVAPAQVHSSETICSLTFASRCRDVPLNTTTTSRVPAVSPWSSSAGGGDARHHHHHHPELLKAHKTIRALQARLADQARGFTTPLPPEPPPPPPHY